MTGPARSFEDEYPPKPSWQQDLAQMYLAWSRRIGIREELVSLFFGGAGSALYVEILWPGAYDLLREETGAHLLYPTNEEEEPLRAKVSVWPTSEQLDQEANRDPRIFLRTDPPRPPLMSYGVYASYRVAERGQSWPISISLTGPRPGLIAIRARRWVYAQMATLHDEAFQERAQLRRRTYSLTKDRAFVRDHLVGLEHNDPTAVLLGDLQPFIRAARLKALTPLRDIYTG